MNDPMPLPDLVSNPFSQTAQKLKPLRDKLNVNSFAAVFGRTLEERQRAIAETTALVSEIENILGESFEIAAKINELGNTSTRNGGFIFTLNKFLYIIDNPSFTQSVSGPCTAVPSGPDGVNNR